MPHQYVPGPEHGHRDGQGNIRWDMRPSAVGEEGMLDELRHRLRAWEAGQLALELSEFSVQALVQEVVQGYAAAAQSKGLQLYACLDPQLPEPLLGMSADCGRSSTTSHCWESKPLSS